MGLIKLLRTQFQRLKPVCISGNAASICNATAVIRIDHLNGKGAVTGSVDRSVPIGALNEQGTKAAPHSDVEAAETALRESEVDTAAFRYVKKNISLKETDSLLWRAVRYEHF
ncbi:hypothetical protein ACLOJK_013451 [Asimina triloba]